VVRDVIFEELEFKIVPSYQKQARQIVKHLLHFYHVAEAEDDPKEYNMCNIQILEVEGEREVEGTKMDLEYYVAPLKIKKIKNGTIENPNMESIGYYLDNQAVERIIELLCEYNDLFLATLS